MGESTLEVPSQTAFDSKNSMEASPLETVGSTNGLAQAAGTARGPRCLGQGDTRVAAKRDCLGRTQSEVLALLAELSCGGAGASLVIGLLTGLAEV